MVTGSVQVRILECHTLSLFAVDRFSGVKATIELCSIVLTANVHVGLDYSLRLIARRESCAWRLPHSVKSVSKGYLATWVLDDWDSLKRSLGVRFHDSTLLSGKSEFTWVAKPGSYIFWTVTAESSSCAYCNCWTSKDQSPCTLTTATGSSSLCTLTMVTGSNPAHIRKNFWTVIL